MFMSVYRCNVGLCQHDNNNLLIDRTTNLQMANIPSNRDPDISLEETVKIPWIQENALVIASFQCKIQKNWCTITVAPTIEHHGGHLTLSSSEYLKYSWNLQLHRSVLHKNISHQGFC